MKTGELPHQKITFIEKEIMPGNITQVVICGAGPTGLSLAAQLLRYNIDFIILEKNKATTPLSKALVVQARSLEIFDEIGLAKKAIAAGEITKGVNVYYKGKERAHLDLSHLGEGVSPFPFTLSLEQSKTEKLLVDYLAANGKLVRWETTFLRYDEDAHGVSVLYQDAEGNEHDIEATYLVGCDGATSPVRHQMGALFHGDTIPKIFYVADVVLESKVIDRKELFIFLIEKGFVLFFPMEGKSHYRMIGILPQKTDDAGVEFEEVKAHLKENLHIPVSITGLRWFATYKVHSRKAAFFAKDHCFIAGDAAHIHTPVGGQGMNTGIQDAYNLAWKLALNLQHLAGERLLQTYDTERSANATHLLQTTDRMFDFMAGTHAFEEFMRLNVFPFLAGIISHTGVFNKNIFPLISQTGIAYTDSSLTVKSSIGHIKSGDRMPYFELPDGRNIFDEIKLPVFKLLCFGNGEPCNGGTPEEYTLPLQKIAITEIPGEIFGNHHSFYIFLRPDNHIAYIGNDLKHCGPMLELFFKKG